MPAENQDQTFAHQLVRWQRQHGRHDLPWQRPRDGYRVWLSEVMLQQTQVATVIPYFVRFLSAFPDLKTLAAAPAEAVMAQWSGLGYYSRARNLHRCAKIVVNDFGGSFPQTRAELMDLPGIGRSTAAAIRVFAHDQRDAILDGNVKRVFCRHFAIHGVPDSALVLRKLWALAERELAHEHVVAYTQGLMDLGATVCGRTKPKCDVCPVSESCQALQEGQIDELPTRRKRASLPKRETTVLVLRNHIDEVFLLRRPDSGIWGGLMSLPESSLPPETAVSAHLQDCGLANSVRVSQLASRSAQCLNPIDHTFTHFKLRLQPVAVSVSVIGRFAADSGAGESRFVPLAAMQRAALPRPIKTLLTGLSKESSS